MVAARMSALVMLALGTAPAMAQDAASLVARYDAAISALRQKNFGPVEQLARDWSRRDFDAAVSRSRRETPEDLQAASLLHLEIAARIVNASLDEALFHVRLGQKLLTPLARTEGTPGDFVARWAVVASSVFLGRTDATGARLALAFALDHRPRDARVRLASGAVDDLASLGLDADDLSARLVDRRAASARRARARLLASAEQEYRLATTLAPNLASARIRLARVLFRRDRLEDARRELDLVPVPGSLPVGERYLWLLFSSAVHERLGDVRAARADLEEAVRIAGERQGAWMALAQLEERHGRPDRARAVVAQGLARRRPEVPDEWWEYRNGRFDQEGLTWLRATVWQ